MKILASIPIFALRESYAALHVIKGSDWKGGDQQDSCLEFTDGISSEYPAQGDFPRLCQTISPYNQNYNYYHFERTGAEIKEMRTAVLVSHWLNSCDSNYEVTLEIGFDLDSDRESNDGWYLGTKGEST